MKETPGGIVTLEILNIQGKFKKEEIVKKVVPKIEKYFGNNKEIMEKYIEKKLDSLCQYGLLGRTAIYYFGLDY